MTRKDGTLVDGLNERGGLTSKSSDGLVMKSSAHALSRLLQEVRACRLCEEHLPLGPRPVLQAGKKAKILIASQAPGRKVHASGVPFDDPSGVRLREWLGVSPEQFYNPELIALLPMGFCYPGSGKSGDLPPRAECAPAWRAALLAQLPSIELTLVMGRYAMDYHLSGGTNLTEKVRDWQSGWPRLLLLPHPSPRNNMWLRKNPWFADQILPALKQRVASLLAGS